MATDAGLPLGVLPCARAFSPSQSFVVLRPGESATAEELMAYCRENMAAFKAPRAIEFRTELPKSSVLKILRRQLRSEELAADSS